MKQITKEQAIEIAKSGAWKNWTDDEIMKFQLYQDKLAMDFGRFHEAVEKVLDRPVWTHEFAFPDSLKAEYEKKKPAPTFQEILDLIPKDKSVIIVDLE